MTKRPEFPPGTSIFASPRHEAWGSFRGSVPIAEKGVQRQQQAGVKIQRDFAPNTTSADSVDRLGRKPDRFEPDRAIDRRAASS
jgi:hypothetical protein